MICQIRTCSFIDFSVDFLSPFACLTSLFLCICISSAVLLCSPWSRHALSGNLLLICLFLVPRPSLTCLFPNWIAPFSSSPSYTWSPVSFSQYASAFLLPTLPYLSFVFLPRCLLLLPLLIFLLFSALSVNNLRLHILTVFVCFLRCLSETLLFSGCVLSEFQAFVYLVSVCRHAPNICLCVLVLKQCV